MNINIKRAGLLLFFLAPFIGGFFLSADETAELWARIYKRTFNIEQRYEVMLNIVELHNRELVPIMESALEELNLITRAANTTEQRTLDELKKIIIKELGNLKASESARTVWDVVRNTTDPILRGEAITAIGMMRAVDYVQELSLMLKNLNMLPPADRTRDAEITAYACVLALERFKDDRGYRPVFEASDGWYSARSGVRDKAKAALQTMVADPTELLTAILMGDSTFAQKNSALAAADRSGAPAEGKVKIAVNALRQGLANNPTSVAETRELSKLRSYAISMLLVYGAKEPESVPLLGQIMRRDDSDSDINERLSAIQALGAVGGDEAAKVLSAFMQTENERMGRGVQPKDPSYREVRAVIQALSAAGSGLGRPVLIEVEYSNWPPAIVREAKAALEKLK